MLLFLCLAVVVALQFLTRYLLNDSLAWTEEIARYLLIAVVYSGSLDALRRQEHIVLTVVYRWAPQTDLKPLMILSELATFVFHASLTLFTIGLALSADRRMISVDLPKDLVYWLVATLLFSSSWATLFRIRDWWRESPEQIRNRILPPSAGDAP
ncbi:MAG: TRAP transporter small permease subunit [Pseudomonadota bacterium]